MQRQFLSLVTLILVTISQTSQSFKGHDKGLMKTTTFLSPGVELDPGSVANKLFYGIDFPRGHIAVKRFDAEVVDEAGKSVPLYDAYIHHWVVVRYYGRKDVLRSRFGQNQSDVLYVRNAGVCNGDSLIHYFGFGSETRKTNTWVPDPYGVEVGNPNDVPEGYEEGWLLNLHLIDTRGAVDRFGCDECRCDLYNATVDESGKPIEKGYVGGLKCCADGTKCRVRQGFKGEKRKLYLKMRVKYLEWSSSILPVKIYIFDVTDTWKMPNKLWKESPNRHHCKIEYNVDSCATNLDKDKCIYTKRAIASLGSGGDVIYCVAHQHFGGIGSTLYGEGGRKICSSSPIYGKGMKPGNEKGYVVGMTTVCPRPGSVKIANGEKLTVTSSYNSSKMHSGVMGMFNILLAQPLHK